jgi:hypothetical protein
MKTLDGFYRGIVAQNNDPKGLGRVKVFVPHLHLASLDLDPEDYNKEFYFSEFGTNYNKSNPNMIDLTKYVEKIKLKLPWAEVSLPVTGGGFSSFNSASNRASTSDSPYFVNQNDEDGSTGTSEGALQQTYPPKDAFSASTDTPNPLGSAYISKSYYNAPKGMFGIPQVNTKVWLFFLEGNPNNPVVFGYSPSPNSYNQIYDETTYPSGYENNDPTGEANPENLKRRNEFVINQKGGSIEINDTDGNEEFNIAHPSGSFTKFSHSGKTNLNVGPEMTLTKGDNFTTIEGSHSFYCDDRVEYIVGKDLNITIGSTNYAAGNEWMAANADVQALKSLSERQNMDNSSVFSSPLAKKSGKNPPCRDCSSGVKRKTYSGKEGVGSEENKNLFQKAQESILGGVDYISSLLNSAVGLKLPEITEEEFPKTENCPRCKGTGEDPSSMGGDFPIDERKNEIGALYAKNAQRFFEAENELGGDVTMDIGGDVFINLGVPNNADSVRVNTRGSATTPAVGMDAVNGAYSTAATSSTVEKVHVDKPPGGQFTINAGHGVAFYSGSGGCDINSTGCLSIYGTVTELTGEQLNLSSKSGMNIATGESLSFNASNIAIESSGQTCLKGSIACDGNLMCTGGAMIQGEMFVQHITAPGVPQETEYQEDLFGEATSSSALKIGFIKKTQIIKMDIPGLGNDIECVVKETVEIVTTDSGQVGDQGAIFVYPHNHEFMGIPTTLYGTYGAARKSAVEMGMGGSEPVLAVPPKSGRAASTEEMPPMSNIKSIGPLNQIQTRSQKRGIIS